MKESHGLRRAALCDWDVVNSKNKLVVFSFTQRQINLQVTEHISVSTDLLPGEVLLRAQ